MPIPPEPQSLFEVKTLIGKLLKSSLVPRRCPPLSGEREAYVRAWERVGVPVSFGDVKTFGAKSISGNSPGRERLGTRLVHKGNICKTA